MTTQPYVVVWAADGSSRRLPLIKRFTRLNTVGFPWNVLLDTNEEFTEQVHQHGLWSEAEQDRLASRILERFDISWDDRGRPILFA